MIAQPRSQQQAALAIVALLALLVVSSASVVPGHWHDRSQCDRCEMCRGGYFSVLEPSVQVVLESLAPVEWQGHVDELLPTLEPVFIASFPRAPPA